jgi:hypothetical protein
MYRDDLAEADVRVTLTPLMAGNKLLLMLFN